MPIVRWLDILNLSEAENRSICRWRQFEKPWNALQVVDFLLTGPLLSLIIGVGVVGGFLCILTFARSYRNLKIYTYLLLLAAWDVFYVATLFLLYNLPTLIYLEIIHFGPYAVGMPFLYYVSTVARTGAIWTVLIIAFERYFALCHPFRFEKMNTDGRVRVLFCTVTVCAFLYSLPRYFEVRILYCYELTTADHVPVMIGTDLRSAFAYWFLYRVIGGGLFYSVVPFVALVVLTIRISVEIKRSISRIPVAASLPECNTLLNGQSNHVNHNHNHHNHHHHHHQAPQTDRLNRWMHVAMITKFLLCHSFPMILDIWELVHPAIMFDRKWRKSWIFMSHSSLFLLALNGSCNLFIYYCTSIKFRSDLKRTVTSCPTSSNNLSFGRSTATAISS